MSSVKAPLQKKSENPHSSFPETELDKATIRFAGDSGDGMQLTGTRFSSTSVLAGNDVTYSTSDLTNSSTYYWKVIATDTRGGSSESATWSFTVQ